MSDAQVADAAVRERAVDVRGSFIVQAPAGSGKTSLLVLRYLSLLAIVDAPEEAVAITFTRKAAAEMRERVMQALLAVASPPPRPSAYQARLLQAAREVLARDAACHWNLLDVPSRMRIQTIDSLCHRIAGQAPVLSGISRGTNLEEDARPLYREAALRTLDWLEGDQETARHALQVTLLHFDNRVPLLVGSLMDMLARRHQWQRSLRDADSALFQRELIEQTFAAFAERKLRALFTALSQETIAEAVALARHSAAHLRDKPEHGVHEIQQIEGALRPRAADVAGWRAIASLLLTGSGSSLAWRKPRGVNAGLGFPKPGAKNDPDAPVHKAAKESMVALLDQLASRDDAASLARMLDEVHALPSGGFSEADWETVQSFVVVLMIAAEELRAVFAQRDALDHAEVMSAALRALGSAETPSELALAMDYQIRHLLVDEFQDTSVTQVDLLRRLLAGWEPGDGRTLFLVGDPMQSIYAFREAEVGLFLQVQQQGIEQVRPESLYLTQNFRSSEPVVDWFNRAFPDVLPGEEDALLGAVSYRAAEAAVGAVSGSGVHVHAFFDEQGVEAACVASLVQQALRDRPGGSVGILVRSRAHFRDIVPALRAADIQFQAVRAEPLVARQCVQDVLALTRALIHPGDRIAWLATMRAPWCGLSLSDLLQLCGEDPRDLLMDRLADAQVIGQLSSRGAVALARIRPVLEAAGAERLRKPLRQWVEGAWLALGGPACLRDSRETADVQAYFSWLETLPAGELPDPAELEQAMAELYAHPDPQGDPRVQLMTLHNAKGLEFDTVILPALDRGTRNGDAPLLLWRELPGDSLQAGPLLVAPLRAAGAEHSPHYRMLQQLESVRSRNETARLAYVGATRARTSLHLLGRVKTRTDKSGNRTVSAPGSSTLLGVMWPAVEAEFKRALLDQGDAPAGDAVEPAENALRRLPEDWQCPPPPAGVLDGTLLREEFLEQHPDYEWVGQGARYTGVVIHGLLEYPDALSASEAAISERVERLLRVHGIPRQDGEEIRVRAMQAIALMRTDERANWLFSSTHRAVQSEYAVTLFEKGRLKNCVIDRTFIDEKGTRWIVDFKTGTHAGGSLRAFLDEEQARYRDQLEAYGRCFSLLEQRDCRLALYFPLLPAWLEWAYETAQERSPQAP